VAPLDARRLSGQRDVLLKFAGLRADVRVADIGLR
jgi:hypothetical protein